MQEGADRENEAVTASGGGHSATSASRGLLGALDPTALPAGRFATRWTGSAGDEELQGQSRVGVRGGEGDRRRHCLNITQLSSCNTAVVAACCY